MLGLNIETNKYLVIPMISINKFIKKNRMNFLPIDFEQNKIIERLENQLINQKEEIIALRKIIEKLQEK